MATIEPGSIVLVQSADGRTLRKRATTGVVDSGTDFPVVYVTTEEEWEASSGNGAGPLALPWPAEDVQTA